MLFWATVLVSVFCWQQDVVPYQMIVQILLVLIILWLAYKNFVKQTYTTNYSISLSQNTDWEYHSAVELSSWRVTEKSRITHFLLWIHLSSTLIPAKTQWVIIFRDQVSEENFRLLCRAVLFQQQTRNS